MNPEIYSNELADYSKLLLSFNPFYYPAVVILLMALAVYILNKYVVIPSRLNYLREKETLKVENLRLMALFAELDPDPVIRISKDGSIIYSNQAAESLFNQKRLLGENIRSILPIIISPEQAINSGLSQTCFTQIIGRHYCVFFRGIPGLNFAQIYFRDITGRRIYEEKLKEFSAYMQHSIEEERKRIAKELHDGIGQNLSLAKFKTQLVNGKISDEELRSEIEEVKNLLEKSICELKDISYNLKPRILDEIGLEPALISLCNNVSMASNIRGRINFEELTGKISNIQETALYRITQEALNNITKHSAASEFSVRVFQDDGRIRLVISDNGRGFDPDIIRLKGNGKNMGLISMRERAEAIGGRLEIETSPGEGTFIIIEIPVQAGAV